MTKKKLQAGVIGLRMGNGHCIGYRDNPHCELAAICDIKPEILADRQKLYSPRLATIDYLDLINDPDLDIISVVTPDYLHAEQCIAALRAGKHVLCDKPLTLNLEEAREIIAEVERGQARFMIGQVCRYAPGFMLAKRLVDQGMIGDLFFVESEYAHNYGKARGVDDWRVDPRREPIIGGGCHAIDLLRWIAGDVLKVTALANHKCLTDWPVNDCTVALLQFDNQVMGKVMASIGCVRPYTMRTVLYGTEGTIICDNQSPEIEVCSQKLMQGKLEFAKLPVNIANHNVSGEIADFVDCILNDKEVATSVYEGAKTVATAIAAVKSAQLGGMPVEVEDIAAK